MIPLLIPSLLAAASTPGPVAARQAPKAAETPARSQEESTKGEAVQETADEDIIHLQETVVTATRYEKSIFDIPMGVTLVDGQELRERTTATAADALRYKPGIWVQNTGNLRGSPVIRGFMGNRVVYLFDGIRRNTAGIFPGPNWFLQNADALDIDRIEVIRGPGSVLYGSDAIGGVVNVITNEKPTYSSDQDFGGRLYTIYNSASRETSGRLESHFSGENFYGFVGGTYRNMDDLEGGRGVGVQDPSSSRERNWDAQFDYRLAAGHELEVFVQDFSRPSGRRFDQPTWKQADDRELLGMRYRASKPMPLASMAPVGAPSWAWLVGDSRPGFSMSSLLSDADNAT